MVRMMLRAACRPSWAAAGATPGTGFPSDVTAAKSPITKTSGAFGTERSWFYEHTPGLVGRRTKRAPKQRRSDSSGPDHSMARNTPSPVRHARVVDAGYYRIEHQFYTDMLELPLGVPRRLFR